MNTVDGPSSTGSALQIVRIRFDALVDNQKGILSKDADSKSSRVVDKRLSVPVCISYTLCDTPYKLQTL